MKCQAGAQQGRSCVEEIMALRLLCDFAKSKHRKPYVLLFDFSKAYDRVPRDGLIRVLKSRGCGKVMLRAIQTMYACTRSVLRSAVMTAATDVRQGEPSSCLFLVTYIDLVVRVLKQNIGLDGFLKDLHTLLLMHDMVILATSREKCLQKLSTVLEYCQEYKMVLNENKTVFIIHGCKIDTAI